MWICSSVCSDFQMNTALYWKQWLTASYCVALHLPKQSCLSRIKEQLDSSHSIMYPPLTPASLEMTLKMLLRLDFNSLFQKDQPINSKRLQTLLCLLSVSSDGLGCVQTCGSFASVLNHRLKPYSSFGRWSKVVNKCHAWTNCSLSGQKSSPAKSRSLGKTKTMKHHQQRGWLVCFLSHLCQLLSRLRSHCKQTAPETVWNS